MKVIEWTDGITAEQYEKMLADQNGRCAICKTSKFGGMGKRLHLDHNHETNEVRGLICSGCNRGLVTSKTA
ncbi:endonuclease VII domain-containing protein [Edaphobacter modestus]|uniref:endonuclease VII domain-containing protein n=1 Tax=Edaphobacter modestus TaxID=388466 RepID=UPI00102C9AB9